MCKFKFASFSKTIPWQAGSWFVVELVHWYIIKCCLLKNIIKLSIVYQRTGFLMHTIAVKERCAGTIVYIRYISFVIMCVLQNSAGKTALEMNLDRRDTDNVVFSFDLDKHTTDRQKSRKFDQLGLFYLITNYMYHVSNTTHSKPAQRCVFKKIIN